MTSGCRTVAGKPTVYCSRPAAAPPAPTVGKASRLGAVELLTGGNYRRHPVPTDGEVDTAAGGQEDFDADEDVSGSSCRDSWSSADSTSCPSSPNKQLRQQEQLAVQFFNDKYASLNSSNVVSSVSGLWKGTSKTVSADKVESRMNGSRVLGLSQSALPSPSAQQQHQQQTSRSRSSFSSDSLKGDTVGKPVARILPAVSLRTAAQLTADAAEEEKCRKSRLSSVGSGDDVDFSAVVVTKRRGPEITRPKPQIGTWKSAINRAEMTSSDFDARSGTPCFDGGEKGQLVKIRVAQPHMDLSTAENPAAALRIEEPGDADDSSGNCISQRLSLLSAGETLDPPDVRKNALHVRPASSVFDNRKSLTSEFAVDETTSGAALADAATSLRCRSSSKASVVRRSSDVTDLFRSSTLPMSDLDRQRIELFYRSRGTQVFVCTGEASLFFGAVRRPSTSALPPAVPPTGSASESPSDWIYVDRGVPVVVLDSGEGRRRRRMHAVLADRRTGFVLWRDVFDHLTDYRAVEATLHTMQRSTDHTQLAAFRFDDETSAGQFLDHVKTLTSGDQTGSLLNLSRSGKAKKKSKRPSSRLPPHKESISSPCCFSHVTNICETDGQRVQQYYSSRTYSAANASAP